jgi:hypothetical protein
MGIFIANIHFFFAHKTFFEQFFKGWHLLVEVRVYLRKYVSLQYGQITRCQIREHQPELSFKYNIFEKNKKTFLSAPQWLRIAGFWNNLMCFVHTWLIN